MKLEMSLTFPQQPPPLPCRAVSLYAELTGQVYKYKYTFLSYFRAWIQSIVCFFMCHLIACSLP
jgi:hypothetical protein